jgi:predicted transcriptional regulator of viral defense system
MDTESKSVTQLVYEYVTAAGRVVSSREIVVAFPDRTRSSITFALTRLTREGSLKRTEHGRYSAASTAGRDDAEIERGDDQYLADLFERIRTSLQFADLAFLYEVVTAARRLAPQSFRKAREKAVEGSSPSSRRAGA